MKRVLVTGSEGFIGSHLVEALVTDGFSVRAFVCYNSFGNRGWLEDLPNEVLGEVEVVFGDVRDERSVRQAMTGSDAVTHLAALIGIPYSYVAPRSYVETNIVGTLNVLESARDLDLESVIHTSTSEVYGSAQYVPIPETHPLVGQSPYSATKSGADQLAYSYWSTFGLPVTILRPFNTYGPRQSTRAVIPSIITQLLSNVESIQLGDTTPTRDFSYVTDTASGFVAALKSSAGHGEVINLGSGFEISVADTVLEIERIVGKKIEVVVDDQRVRPKDSEVRRLFADIDKANKVFGWKPKYGDLSGFQRGLAQTIEWFSDSENLKKYEAGIYSL